MTAAPEPILDLVSESVIVTDLDGRITSWNRAAERLFGYRADEMIGATPAELYPDVSAAALARDLREVLEGRDFAGEWIGRRKDGNEIRVAIRTTLLRDETGRPIGFVGVGTDVTERRRVEHEIASSEVRLRFATLAASEAIYDWDLDTGTVTSNDALRSTFGWDPEEVEGPDWWLARLHPDDRDEVQSSLEQVIASGGRTWSRAYRFVRADGRWADVLGRAYVAHEGGRPVRVIGAMQDVTEEQREMAIAAFLSDATAVLSSSDAFEHTLGEVARRAARSIADWCSLDVRSDDGTFSRPVVGHADPAHAELARELTLHPPSTHPGHPPARAIALGRPVVIPTVDDETIAQIAAGPEHDALIRRIGVRSYLVVPVTAPDGAIAVLTFVQARSGRRWSERDLDWAADLQRRASSAIALARALRERTALLARAEHANLAKDEFLAMLGHELRNPLSPILTALELMRMRAPNELARERAVIERQVGHMVRLVDDLLDVSRITRGRIDLRRAPVELAEVIAGAVETASTLIERGRHALAVQVPTGLVVDGDRDRLRQVFANLISNAAKYTDPGGHIEIHAEPVDERVRVRVTDDGRGIDRELLPVVFEAFAQGPRALDRSEGGLGLGLAIVRSLVSLHGGTVRVESAGRGAGSTFEVELPLAPVRAEGAGEPAAATSSEAAPAGRVIVVDDNEDAGRMLALALERLGWQVRLAHDGPSALAELERFAADVALLDIGLPVMDGYELARRLRERGSPPRLVAVTGYGQERDRERAREAGFDEHMVKPVSLDRLDALMRRWRR